MKLITHKKEGKTDVTLMHRKAGQKTTRKMQLQELFKRVRDLLFPLLIRKYPWDILPCSNNNCSNCYIFSKLFIGALKNLQILPLTYFFF